MSTLTDLAQKVRDPIAHGIESLISRAMLPHAQQIEDLMILQGRGLALANWQRAPLLRLQDAEFKVFSQFGEDGILQYLIREALISREESSFIEFGVQDYSESNTRFLLMNDHWRGMIIDGSKAYMDQVRSQRLYWRHDLTAVDAWIDRDNIDTLIGSAGFGGPIGLLSVDIDGNDYWVWERIESVDPVIVVAEYNGLFGSKHAVSVPYDRAFDRTQAHHSNLYWGTSIAALAHLAGRKGYSLVGANTAGNNVFFVRNDRLGRLTSMSASEAYFEPRFRESRDVAGNLTYLGAGQRHAEVRDLPLVEVISGEMTTLGALDARNSS